MPDSAAAFTHVPLPAAATFQGDGNVVSNLQKWDLFAHLRLTRYKYSKHYHRYDAEGFANDFLKDASVLQTLPVLGEDNKTWTTASEAHTDESASAAAVPATLTSVDALEKVKGTEAVRDDGMINKQFDAEYHGIVASDVLRDMLLAGEEAEVSADDIWTEKERDEFLVQLFRHLAVGGTLNQFEDHVQPLIDTARAMYKSLLSVRKGANDTVEVTSGVYRVTGRDGAQPPAWLFPGGMETHPQSFCYLITDPVRKHVVVLYHKHATRW